ncbi:hypothetical protein C2G38_2279499 [Gigaspora rosea]|uniref:Uncharacterized protein n=1 Tax=Gigaspora rosea TaxID=44941 RepID=A0A397VR63_9GLOM|nr:hypothetical protein C2G38_2279499 [Gigaspora rosea]
MKANGQEPATTQGKVVDRFSALPERVGSQHSSDAFEMPFFCTRIVNKQIVDTLMNSLFPNVQRIGASERAALQKWVFGLTKAKRPTIQQFSEYITEKNWAAFLKHHMDATDVQKTFRDQPENVDKFSNFIRSAFDLFIQEDLLDKDVVIEFKNLNHLTVDMNIFTADGKDSLQKLDHREKDLQPHESYTSQNTASHASLGPINGEEDISNSDSLQENLSDRDQHINNYCSTNNKDCSSNSDSFQENFSYRSQHINDYRSINGEDDSSDSVSLQDWLESMASDMLSSSDQSTNTEEVELEIEGAKEFRQTIVDSGINFQALPGEYGPYFKNITEMLFFTWVTKHMTKQRTRVGRIIAIVSTSSGMKLKVQRLYYGSELPKIFATSASFTFTEQTYIELDEALKIEHALLLKFFPDSFNNLPNLHINRHHVQNARNFGMLANTSVGIKEMVHKIFKSSVSKMNCKNIEFDFIRRHNTLQTIRYLINGGMDSRFPHIGQGFQNFTMDPLLQPILSDWYITQNIQEEDMADTNTNITSHDDKIRNIKTRRRLSKSEIHKLSLPEKLDNNNQFTYDVISAYDIYMQKRAALIYRRVEFYHQISYTLLNKDGTFDTYMTLHSGNIVQMQEENGRSYAILKGIFIHKYNDGLVYSFVWVDWLQERSSLDPILHCPVYKIQAAENTR